MIVQNTEREGIHVLCITYVYDVYAWHHQHLRLYFHETKLIRKISSRKKYRIYNTLFTLMCCKRQIFCGAKVLKFSMQHAKLPIFLKIYTL